MLTGGLRHGSYSEGQKHPNGQANENSERQRLDLFGKIANRYSRNHPFDGGANDNSQKRYPRFGGEPGGEPIEDSQEAPQQQSENRLIHSRLLFVTAGCSRWSGGRADSVALRGEAHHRAENASWQHNLEIMMLATRLLHGSHQECKKHSNRQAKEN